MSSKSTESKNPSRKSGPLSRASRFFYTKSNLVTALLATSVFASYLLFFLTKKGAAFEVANSSVKSLGTSLGFGQTEILAFLAERSDQMINAYIHKLQSGLGLSLWFDLRSYVCGLGVDFV